MNAHSTAPVQSEGLPPALPKAPSFIVWAVAIIAPLSIAFRPSPLGVWLDWVAGALAWLSIGLWLWKRFALNTECSK